MNFDKTTGIIYEVFMINFSFSDLTT